MRKPSVRCNYLLGRRLDKLPRGLYREMRARVIEDIPYGHGERWRRILKGTTTDLRAQEAAIMCEMIGCTIHELLDPKANLLRIYLENVEKKAEKDLASKLGLA